VLQKIDEEYPLVESFVVVFRSTTGRQDFRALYAFIDGQFERIYTVSPTAPVALEPGMVAKSFRYDSGGREFREIPLSFDLHGVTDAVLLHGAPGGSRARGTSPSVARP
jgi:hypothetical protein